MTANHLNPQTISFSEQSYKSLSLKGIKKVLIELMLSFMNRTLQWHGIVIDI